jgi:rSAM/selenodomain-associated transferase 2
MTRLSIIVPALDEAAGIAAALAPLAAARAAGVQVIVVDGGSTDGTATAAAPLADAVIAAPRGRASQMNAGAAIARGEVLLFLHADTRLPAGAAETLAERLQASGRAWGRFDVRIDGRHRLLALVAALMNLRSRLTGIATGDQAMFFTRDAFRALGGFPPLPLMEDVALSAAAKRLTPPLCLRERATTSGRRWDERGVLRTVLEMWWLRLRYFLGASPERLHASYYRDRVAPAPCRATEADQREQA